MAKVALICLYDNWALGLRTLANALVSHGHDVTVINFKLPASKELDDFLRYPLHYETVHPNESYTRMVLRGHGIDVNMWTRNEIGLLGDLLKELHPDVIGLSTRSIYEDCNYIDQVIDQIKRIPSAITIAGGFGATFSPERYLKTLDYVCVGEGEDALIKVAGFVDNGKIEEIRKINNLVYTENGSIIFNRLEAPSDSEDYMFSHITDRVKRYVIEDNVIKEGTTFIKNILDKNPAYAGEYFTMAGRGCLWECSFCSAGRFYKKYHENNIPLKRRRLRPMEKVIGELRAVKEQYGFKKVFFMDSYFFAPLEYLMKFFELYKKDVNLPFFAQFYPPQIMHYPQILDAACGAGLMHTVIGIQSGSEEICRKIMNRVEPADKIIEFANMICKHDNILLDYHLITHNPFEKEEHINETMNLLARLPKKNSQLVLARLRPFPTSKIADMIKNAGLNPLDNMERDRKNFVLYLIKFYSSDEAFEKVSPKVDALSFEDLREIYADVRKEYDAKFPLYSRINSSGNPTFIQKYRGFSIVFYGRKMFALAKSLGNIDLTQVEENTLRRYQESYKCYIGDSIEEVRHLVDNQPFYRVLKQELTVLKSALWSYITDRVKSFKE